MGEGGGFGGSDGSCIAVHVAVKFSLLLLLAKHENNLLVGGRPAKFPKMAIDQKSATTRRRLATARATHHPIDQQSMK